jgi:hypothetical protein
MTSSPHPGTRPTPQLRLGGATILLGGLLTAAGYVLEPTTALEPVIVPASWLIFSGTVLLLVGLPAFHAGQAHRAGAFGWWAVVTLCLGLALSQLPMAVIGWADRPYMYDDAAFHAGAAGTAEFFGLLVLLVGVVLTAVATYRAAVYPRWATWCLLGIVAVSLVCQFSPDLNSAVRYPAEDFLLAGLLGVAVLRRSRTSAAQNPVPVPVA